MTRAEFECTRTVDDEKPDGCDECGFKHLNWNCKYLVIHEFEELG